MPGRRNLQRERAQHAQTQPQRQAELLTQLRTVFPHLERPLVGWPALLEHLASRGVRAQRRARGFAPISRFVVLRWARDFGCPIHRGTFGRHPPTSTSWALDAWLYTQFANGDPVLGLVMTSPYEHPIAVRARHTLYRSSERPKPRHSRGSKAA